MSRKFFLIWLLPIYCFLLKSNFCFAISGDTTLRVLVVIAHPDDESSASCTIYKITHQLHSVVDLAVITNGEAGYKYSTLAEDYYGLKLTDPEVGREYLPRIRKEELMNAGKIIGINNYFFFDQKDDKYGLNPKSPLDTFWNTSWVKQHLHDIIITARYDYIFCLLPESGTHGGHKAATILTLQAVKELPVSQRPIILGISGRSKGDTALMKYSDFDELQEYPITKINHSAPVFSFDRTQKFGYKDALDYRIIYNWEIAEHKSQGTMQTFMNKGDYEDFYYFDLNASGGIQKTKMLFERLKVNPYPTKVY
ncbi:MAG: PIG-L family deacetylase [Chitinophagales bacterium]|nr:PIG-L family deacetylase [Chitinophagales bacterium]